MKRPLDYLESFINYEKIMPAGWRRAFKLQRMVRLLGLLGNPHKNLKVIHVTGTKGKGSTASMAASILKEAGLCAGLYTSPHLESFRERIRVNGEMIDEDAILGIVSGIKRHLESLRKDGLSFFEVYTAVAFLYFKQMKVDIAVLEVGLGGRLDATNVVEKSVCVITPVSLEHTRILGSTLGEIAREKAGIIKDGSVCICAPQEKEALDVIEAACRQNNARLYLVGRDIHIDEGAFDRDSQRFSVCGKFDEYPLLTLNLRGEHQIVNAAAAVGAVDALGAYYNIFIPKDAVRAGLLNAEWPGRMEVIDDEPLLVLDGAQNTASARALVNGIRRHFSFNRLILILGISKDKDLKGVCGELAGIADFVILTRADNPRAADPGILKRYIKNKPAAAFTDSEDALRFAYSKAQRNDLILAAGSLFLVGEIRRSIGQPVSRLAG